MTSTLRFNGMQRLLLNTSGSLSMRRLFPASVVAASVAILAAASAPANPDWLDSGGDSFRNKLDKANGASSGTGEAAKQSGTKAAGTKPTAPVSSAGKMWLDNLAQMRDLNSRKDYESLFKLLSPIAEAGDMNAQYELSNLYYNGKGVGKDLSKSADWAEKSANKGHPGAQYMMGGFSLLGQVLPRNPEKAARWFRLAADQGHREAQFSLGMCYLTADASQEDQDTGLHWLEKASGAGSSSAKIALSQHYVRQDPALAFNHLASAANTGSPVAILMLGDYYHNGIGVTKDDTKALQMWKKAADLGSAEGQRSVGQAYREGLGVKPDLNESFTWTKKSAEQGNAKAAYDLGQHYLRGIGVETNEELACTWFQRSAASGNALAENSLGALYLEGRGVKQDPQQALKWFEKAASRGYPVAKENAEMVKEQLAKGNSSKFSVKRSALPGRIKDGL